MSIDFIPVSSLRGAKDDHDRKQILKESNLTSSKVDKYFHQNLKDGLCATDCGTESSCHLPCGNPVRRKV